MTEKDIVAHLEKQNEDALSCPAHQGPSDTIGIGLAAAGLLNPLLAAFIHVTSELTFILNSTRLLPPRKKIAVANENRVAAHEHA